MIINIMAQTFSLSGYVLVKKDGHNWPESRETSIQCCRHTAVHITGIWKNILSDIRTFWCSGVLRHLQPAYTIDELTLYQDHDIVLDI